MKSNNLISIILILVISAVLSLNITAQMRLIPHIPDLQQPIVLWWGNVPDHTCVPAAAANICVYWDDSIHHSNAAESRI
jgi:hypothetical protein